MTTIGLKTIVPRMATSLLCSLLSCFIAAGASAQLRYDDEYPFMHYSTAQSQDSYSQLIASIKAGEAVLEHSENRGYLDSLLTALEIDPSSQVLVYSKSALKKRFVDSNTPRALYFNDEVYVAFIQESRSLEISAMDPVLGPVFFILSQNPEDEIVEDRQLNRCLRCHDSYSLTGGGYPRFLLSSGLVWPDGETISHEFSLITDTATPLNRRWGGWFVEGLHGEQEHMGNLLIKDVAELRPLNLTATGNRGDISEIVNIEPYAGQSSDIVALLVLEHQIEVQNQIARVNYSIGSILNTHNNINQQQVAEITEPLVLSMLSANEVALTDSIEGFSGYTQYFQSLGPKDSQGRSLRQLNLETRTFEYPLSYLIYSEAFQTMPEVAIEYIYNRLNIILTEDNKEQEFAHIDAQTKSAILEILYETKPDFH